MLLHGLLGHHDQQVKSLLSTTTMVTTYIVKRGDSLPRIAHSIGRTPEEIWNHPKNAELRSLRKDWHILFAGDIIFLGPAVVNRLPILRGQVNRYVATVPKHETRLCIANDRGPFANEPYTITGLGDPVHGTTDVDGYLTIVAPVIVRTVRVTFPARKATMDLSLGDMDPITEVSGVQMRLLHLGFLHCPATGELDATTVAAVRAFQRAKRLHPTGEIDQATQEALKEAFGC